MIIALQTLIFFREALVRVLDSLLRPYYKNFRLTFNSNEDLSDDEDSEDQVFAEYHDEKGVVFFPPMYVQRYAAVSDCLMDEKWCGKLEKVVDFGYHDMSFIKYLKEVPGIKHIMGVDIESIPLQCSSDLFGCEDYIPKRENPLKVTLFQGNAADPDYRLIGCDAVVAIEMIEHMLPHDLERFIHTVFGFIKPWVVILTTPNGDFNVLFKSLEKNGLRRLDHFFEWSREQFNDWCSNIVVRYPQYTVCSKGIGPGPPDTLHLGCCSQMAVFVARDYEKQRDLNMNSLAMVASKDVPNHSNFEDMSSSYECIPDNNMLYLTNEELLEWNGYQIVDDVVIHSRLVVDTASVATQEDDWLDNDTISDWDTSDLRSTSLSDGSTNVPEFYGRCLRRALDQKVRKLRKLLSADEDITSELDRVVCRLMKLALHTSRNRQTPVPASWMQCKLYDLLALTEKAIERRKKHFLEEYTLRAIEYDKGDNDNQCKLALSNVQEDNRRTDEIMHEYQDLVQPLDEGTYNLQSESDVKLGEEDENENDLYKDETNEISLDRDRPQEIYARCESFAQKTKLEIVREWVDEEYGSYSFNANQQERTDVPSSVNNYKYKDDQTALSSSGLLDTKAKKKSKGHKKLQSSVAPIPDSLIELCQTNTADQNKSNDRNLDMDNIQKIEYNLAVCDDKDNKFENVAATQNSCIISIVTHDTEELVALKRSIATELDPDIVDQEAIIEQVINITKECSLNFPKADNEDVQSQTIFLIDINEPSTSKGIRHTRLDVQCGPDDIQDGAELSANTSFAKLPKLFSKGIKIGQSHTDLLRKSTFETGTSPDSPCCNETPKSKCPGVWIHDSDTNAELTQNFKPECSTITTCDTKEIVCSEIIYDEIESKPETNLIKPVTSGIKADCSGSEHGCRLSEIKMESPQRLTSPLKNTSSVQIQSCTSKSDLGNSSPIRHVKPKLSCGGICVHSFRDREVSQDVVFQGGWNEINPITPHRKTFRKPPLKKGGMTARKLKRSSSTSVRNTLNKKELNYVNRRPTYINTAKQSNVKNEQANKTAISKKVNLPLKNKNNKALKEVPPKNTLSAKTAKYIRERQNISTNSLGKDNVFERPNIQNYLPPYLKRKPCKSGSTKNNLSKSIDSAKPLTNIKAPLVRSNTEEIKRHTFKDNPRMYVSYQVFRNEIENKNYSDNIGRVDYRDVGSNSIQRRSSSPISQQSSCSTSNSIATIRDMRSTVKLEANKMHSTSANTSGITKSTMTTFGSSIGSKIKNGESSTEKCSFQSSPSDTVIVLEPYKDELLKGFNDIPLALKLENIECDKEKLNETAQSAKSECMESISVDSYLEESLTKLFEENIEFATSTPKSNQNYFNPDVIVFQNPDSESSIFNTTSSPASFKTVIENKNSCTFKNELKDALNYSFSIESNLVDEVNSNVTINLTECSRTAEFTSLESMGSLSKHSEYFLADNQVDPSTINNEPSVGSVKGLFERKDLNAVTNVAGPIALQAFSGFSVNVVPLAGDQPAYINLVDPETGILRQEVNRQATSEEILVSGRSSDTYESCYVEDESFVPSWLFNIISQQQSMDESEEDDEDRLPLPLPIVEPIFDVNGNIAEPGVGAGAGAGDGRGMHSDHSQDSSGRGTSLSSSDTSSDVHSEMTD
ncbi:uncharacterized protein LOC119830513 [Zerene cesonia]|uniref:uncharacterized protein LOC119830513 n=1 Tax=Zerene cesonia TaxID=33412 RepID=UPI0018E56C4C|nr:uncharacterized protein LOC119830513 [Zerene cesonia]